MQLVRYLAAGGVDIGAVQGDRVVCARIALSRLAQLDGRMGPFAHLYEYACSEPKVLLSLGAQFRDALAEAIERDDGTSVVTEGGLKSLRVLPFVPDPEKVFGMGYNYNELCEHERHAPPDSHVIRAGNLLFISGQASRLPTGEVVGKGDIGAQAARAYKNLQTAIEQSGSRLDLVIKLSIYATDVRFKPALDEARRRLFAPTGHMPAALFLVVTALNLADFLVEIDAIAAVGDESNGRRHEQRA